MPRQGVKGTSPFNETPFKTGYKNILTLHYKKVKGFCGGNWIFWVEGWDAKMCVGPLTGAGAAAIIKKKGAVTGGGPNS